MITTELTDQERGFLELYRELSPDQKVAVHLGCHIAQCHDQLNTRGVEQASETTEPAADDPDMSARFEQAHGIVHDIEVLASTSIRLFDDIGQRLDDDEDLGALVSMLRDKVSDLDGQLKGMHRTVMAERRKAVA